MALTGVIKYKAAIPLIIGANIGTTISPLISAIGSKVDAKRVSLTHFMFNVFGSVWIMLLVVIFSRSPIMNAPAYSVHIAFIHTMFNVVTSLIIYPLKRPFMALIERMLPYKDERDVFLDERLLATPTVAVNEIHNLTGEMAYLALESVYKSLDLINNYSEKEAVAIVKEEVELDTFYDKISSFLNKLGAKDLNESNVKKVNKMQYSIGNFERLGDHALNILEAVTKIVENDLEFSESSKGETQVIISALKEILDMAVNAYINDDLELAIRIEPLEEVIDNLIAKAQNNHVDRLVSGECTLEAGLILSEILGNCERVSDHCSNIGICVIETQEDNFNAHKYLENIKHESEQFRIFFKEFQQKYKLN